MRHEAARTVVLYREEDAQRSNTGGRPFALAGIRRTAAPIVFERVD